MTITVNCHCPLCGQTTLVSCTDAQWNAYEDGALAQDAFSDMDLHTRETIISGMCLPCQEAFFDAEEDDDDCEGECEGCPNFICPAHPQHTTPCEV